MVMFVQIAQSLLKSQAQLLQHQLQALWTSVIAEVVHVRVAVAAQTVEDLAEVHVTSVVVQTVVVHVAAQEMVPVQAEDLQVSLLASPVADLLAIAKQ